MLALGLTRRPALSLLLFGNPSLSHLFSRAIQNESRQRKKKNKWKKRKSTQKVNLKSFFFFLLFFLSSLFSFLHQLLSLSLPLSLLPNTSNFSTSSSSHWGRGRLLQKTSSKNEISPPPKPPRRLDNLALHPHSLAAEAPPAREAPPPPSSLAWPPPSVVRLFRLRQVSLILLESPPGPQKKTPMCSSGCVALTWPCFFFGFFLGKTSRKREREKSEFFLRFLCSSPLKTSNNCRED